MLVAITVVCAADAVDEVVVPELLINAEPVEEAVNVLVVKERLELVVVVKRDRSCCWYCTVIAWPHIVTGPMIVVLLNAESADRATTVVAGFELAYVLTQPAKSKYCEPVKLSIVL